ncbi:hypothetical protein [Lacinutrix sp. MEBiC02404]
MKYSTALLLVLFFIFNISLAQNDSAFAPNSLVSQNSTSKDPISNIINNGYFNTYNLESFYLHTNKSIYFSQEEIFFKAYVVHEENNKPSLETSNLHINLYDSDNKLVLSELFYTDNGTSYGSIPIPKDLKTGNYTIQLNTQWNKNFKEGALFPIQIYNIEDTTTSIETIEDNEIANLKNNTKEAFVAENKIGYILQKKEPRNKEIVTFQLKTNSNTVAAEKEKFVYAVLHKKGSAKSVAPIKLIQGINTYTLNFNTIDLFKGTNTITVFNQQNNILAQCNYYHKPEKEIDITSSILKETSDSISLDLKLLNILKETNISISVLHEQTKAIDKEATITKTLLANTDDVLATSSSYDAFPYKNRTNITPILENENGLQITGTVNTKIQNTKNYSVMLTSHANNLLITSPISSDKKFEFKNLLIKYPSDYKLSLVNKKGEIAKGEFYIYKDFVAYKADSILKNNTVKKITVKNTTEEKAKEENNNSEIVNLFPVNKEIEELEEVFLKDIVNKEQQRLKEIKKENPYLGISAGFSQDHLIDLEKDGVKSLIEYLEALPGIRIQKLDNGTYTILKTRPTSITSTALMLFFIDGAPMSQTDGLDIAEYSVTDFELITVNMSGAGYGLQGSGGAINLITRKGFSRKRNKTIFAKDYETQVGFNMKKSTFADSKLYFQDLQSTYYFKAIDWVPNFTVKPNRSNILKIKKSKYEKIKLIINGFNADGDLIYKVIEL